MIKFIKVIKYFFYFLMLFVFWYVCYIQGNNAVECFALALAVTPMCMLVVLFIESVIYKLEKYFNERKINKIEKAQLYRKELEYFIWECEKKI